MGVLTFPQKYRLLAEQWSDLQPTTKGAAKAFGVNPSELSRWSNGKTLRSKKSEARLTSALADYLEREQLLEAHGFSKADFLSIMREEDDLLFLNKIKQRNNPFPRLSGIQSFEGLRDALRYHRGAILQQADERLFFLYRLGFNSGDDFFEKSEDKLQLKNDQANCKLVLRRIPVRIRHANPLDEYFTYEEYYTDDLAGPGKNRLYTALAAGYVFRDFLTILSRDIRGDAKNSIELSVAQVDLTSGSKGSFSGIISMRSDCSVDAIRWDPTSYRIILKAAPTHLTWEDEPEVDGAAGKKGAKSMSRTEQIIDITKDDIINENDFRDFRKDEIDDGESFSHIFNRLNVMSTPADLLVAHPVRYVRHVAAPAATTEERQP